MPATKRKPKKKAKAQGSRRPSRKTTGAPAPMQGRCGAYLQRTDPPTYCMRYPLKGRTRCKLHGGATPRGPDSPHWIHGRRSQMYRDLLDGSLLQGYLAIQNDEDLITTQEQIRLWSARERQLVERLSDHGESSAAWRTARMAMGEVDGAADPQELAGGLRKLRAAILEGANREQAWDDLERCHETLRKLKEAERKKRQSDHAMLSVDHVMHLASLLTALALKYIEDETKRLEFADGVNRLARGEPLELGPGIELGWSKQ